MSWCDTCWKFDAVESGQTHCGWCPIMDVLVEKYVSATIPLTEQQGDLARKTGVTCSRCTNDTVINWYCSTCQVRH